MLIRTSYLIVSTLVIVLLSSGVASALDRSEVRVTHDPNWNRLSSFSDVTDEEALRLPFEINLIQETGDRGTGRILLVVNSGIYSSITTGLNQYWNDLLAAGYTVELYTASGGTPANLRSYLQTKFNDGTGLEGVMLIGDLPIPWFEINYDFDGPDGDTLDNEYVDFPCDLFYMDMDGTWLDSQSTYPFQSGVYDSHTDGAGDCAPDIWVGRLTASPMTLGSPTESGLLNNYFAKDHNFRTGALCPAERALIYADDDWFDVADGIDSDASASYTRRVLVKDKVTTCCDDYKDTRLQQSFEMMHVMLHSDPTNHYFKVNDAWEMDGGNFAAVTSNNIRSYDPKAVFYNLYACSNCRYTENDYMGGWYIYTDDHGLAAVGTTKIGGMWDYTTFYGQFGTGISLGEAFRQWLEAQAPYDQGDVRWYYGMTVLGDAALTLRPQVVTNSPARNELGVAHNTSVTVDFDRDMKPTACNGGSFPVWGSVSGLHFGTYTYDSGNRRHSFVPHTEFMDGEVVTAVLSRKVVSTENVPSSGNAWSFTVGIGNPTPGTFIEGGFYDGGQAYHVYSADLNRDGYPDLATATYMDDQLVVAMNNGMGGFHSPVYYSTGPDPRWVVGGDFNGDGDIDLAVTNSTSMGYGTELAIFTNTGSGSFTGPTNYGSFQYPGNVIAGDYDNDGDIDLALIAGHSTQRFLITYWNTGTGTFVQADYQQLPGMNIGQRIYLAGDVDSDGDLDLVGVQAGDYGVADDSLFVLNNRGDRYFDPSCPSPLSDGPFAVCGNDFDGDGDIDFAVSSAYTSNMEVHLNAGDGTIETINTHNIGRTNAYNIVCGDWDGDGDIDIAQSINTTPYGISISKNNGNGTFASPAEYTTWSPHRLAVGDFDDDGDLDIAAARGGIMGQSIGILLNDGSADYSAPGRVANLSGTASGDRSSAVIDWTAPGDDGHVGRAHEYDLRYSTSPVGSDTLAWWNAASQAVDEPAPSLAGTPESCSIAGLDGAETYYLMLRSADEVPNWSGYSNVLELLPAVDDVDDFVRDPERSMLYASSPNPVRESTMIRYALSTPAKVRLAIYDTSGRRVRVLVDSETQQPGTYPITWDRRDESGAGVASGIYFYRLQAGSFVESRRLVCLR